MQVTYYNDIFVYMLTDESGGSETWGLIIVVYLFWYFILAYWWIMFIFDSPIYLDDDKDMVWESGKL